MKSHVRCLILNLFIIEYKNVFDAGSKRTCYAVGQFKRWIILAFLKENDSLTAHPDYLCQLFLGQAEAGAVFLHPGSHACSTPLKLAHNPFI